MIQRGSVLVKVAWSSVNYKDAWRRSRRARWRGSPRLSPGSTGRDRRGLGEEVLAHGYDLGVALTAATRSTRASRSDGSCRCPGPERAPGDGDRDRRLHRRALRVALEAAGLTRRLRAGAGHRRQRRRRLDRRRHPCHSGYEVVASSGKNRSPALARRLGGHLARGRGGRLRAPLEKTRWAGAVDCVGGEVLAGVLRSCATAAPSRPAATPAASS